MTNGYKGDIEYNNMGDTDKNWYVETDGSYRIIFDLEKGKVSLTTDFSEVLPVLTSSVYAVGDATPGEWNALQGSPLTVDESDPYIFTYQMYLKEGKFKFSLRNDKDFDGNWIHPSEDNVTLSGETLTDCRMDIFRGAGINDNQWTVSVPGTYKLTLDLRNMKMNAEYLSDKIVANQLYIVGDLTGWGFFAMDKVADNVFESTFENCESGKRFRASLYMGLASSP